MGFVLGSGVFHYLDSDGTAVVATWEDGTMNKGEARDKFGSVSPNEEGEPVWRAERSKLRGVLLRYARTREEIVAPVPEHEPEYYIDDFWSWLKDKMGDGFGGVFRNDEMSPSGKFDRVSKDGMVRLANHMYGPNEEFTELMDDLWVHKELEDDDKQEQVEMYESFKESSGLPTIQQFYEIEWKPTLRENEDDPRAPDTFPSKEGPKPEGFKEALKEYTKMAKTIVSDSDEPNAEDFVDDWIQWMNEHVQGGTYHIVDDRNHYKYDWMGVVDTDNVVKWAKELWKEDKEFRDNVKELWNNFDDRSDDDDGEDDDNLERADHGGLRHKNKRGQQTIGDY